MQERVRATGRDGLFETVEREITQSDQCISSAVQQPYAYSIALLKSSTFFLKSVNLLMKEYAKTVSQRSRGCVAFDGGQTWYFGIDSSLPPILQQ